MKFYFEEKEAAIAFIEQKKDVLQKQIASQLAEILDIPNKLREELDLHKSRCWFDKVFGFYSEKTIAAKWREERVWINIGITNVQEKINSLCNSQDKIRNTEGFTFVEIEE